MGRNLVADLGQFPGVTDHKGAAFSLMFALAFHALDQNYTGQVSAKTLTTTARLTPGAFRQAWHDIECSGEIQVYDRPGKSCVYFLWWMYACQEMREGNIPPVTLEWPAQFQQLGHKCPRPERTIYTETHSNKIRQLFAIDLAKRQARKARKIDA